MERTDALKAIMEKILEYDKIVISRHIRPDGDAAGSSGGLCGLLRASFPDKTVIVCNSDRSRKMGFLSVPETSPGELPEGWFGDALAIVTDTATSDRISNPRISEAGFIIKIDHHIDTERYGDINWIEDGRASCSEMIAIFASAFPDRLKLTPEAAACLYTGIVTDTGRFRHRGVDAGTHNAAAFLLGSGIDTEKIYAELYLDDISFLKYKSAVYDSIELTPNGVAYVFIPLSMRDRFGLDAESASLAVSFLESIRGSLIWIAFIENGSDDPAGAGTVRVRLRSRFLDIDAVAAKYGGGGHARAAGATLRDREEITDVLADADRLLGEFKSANADLI